MKRTYSILTALAILLVAGFLYAEMGPTAGDTPVLHKEITDSSDLALLRSIYQDFVDPQGNDGCSVDFTTTSVLTTIDGVLDTTVARMSYASNKERMHLISDSLSLFNDSRLMVAVIPSAQEIYLTSLDGLDYKDVKRHLFAVALESLFDEGTVVETGPVHSASGSIVETGDGESDRKIVIEPGYELRSRVAAERVTIVFNRESRTLRDVLIEFAPGQRVRSTRISYGEFRWGELPPEFALPISELIFDSEGHLLPAYVGYTVEDRRDRRPS